MSSSSSSSSDSDSESDEEDETDSSSTSEDITDDHLVKDEEDRLKLASMTDVERELELYKR